MAKGGSVRPGLDSRNFPYHRIVVKLGTSLLTGGSEHLNEETMSDLVRQVARLHQQGVEVVVVSSGAIAAGREKVRLARGVKGIPLKQVLASIGQSRLMNVYDRLFGQYNITIGQALLTRDDLSDRAGYLNARNTLLAMLELKVLCIVNENDVVAVDEIGEVKFGDNDNLSALVANLIDADLLVLLADVGGLYTADPHRHAGASLITEVRQIDAEVEDLAAGTASSLGTGGMVTKVEAARLATASGVTVVIASGREPDVMLRLVSGERLGTSFRPVHGRLDSRKRWMMSGLSARGKLVLDSGAAVALRKQNRSLLAAGIRQVTGKFQRGDIVDIYDPEGVRLGCGITSYSSGDIAAIKGTHSGAIAARLGYDYGAEVVHRNNLVVLD